MDAVLATIFFTLFCLVWALRERKKRIRLEKKNAELAEICKILQKILIYGEGKEGDPFILLTAKERELYDEFIKTHTMITVIGSGGRHFQIPIGFSEEFRKMNL